MADQKSKKIDENNVEDTKEDGSEKEQSAASQDETSDTTQSSDDSPNKAKKPAKEIKNKKEDKKKEDKKKEEESEQESSDDEELVGILDAPLVVEGKRVRKSTEFLSSLITAPQSKERRKTDIPEGKGEKLGSMPRVQLQLSKIPGEELKPLHKILFGRPGTASEVKKHIKQFNGFNIEKGSKEYQVKKEQVDRFTQDSMKRLCEILDVEKKGSKEDVLERVMDFLLCPKASGKEVPVKKGPKNKKNKKQPESKAKKVKPKKAKSNENVESDKDSDEEKDDEPPKKKAKSSTKEKKETKKPAKKEKKVVSIKISPGKKAKKTKEKKAEPDNDESSDDEPLSKKAKKSPPSNEEIVELVKELLDGADLEKITMKSVCKQVYDHYPAFDLTDRKEFIKEAVKEIIT
ncbi:protein DEK-like [Dendronephthya gigantea]|uniref:protein DEK-like n=1 Tax=Dendronephthya gigantea TaxID=151771 RepID=UPI00106B1FAD|nr:protein DEK-like [Dendronephthya gigantea]